MSEDVNHSYLRYRLEVGVVHTHLKARLSILNAPFEQIDRFELKSLKSSFRALMSYYFDMSEWLKGVKTKNDIRKNADNLKIVSFSIVAFYQNAVIKNCHF